MGTFSDMLICEKQLIKQVFILNAKNQKFILGLYVG